MTSIVNALLPVYLTLLVGYFAALHHDIEGKSANVLNRMVITYALPLGLFAGTVTMQRDQLSVSLRLAAILVVGMVIPFVVTLLISRLVVRRSLAESTLQAMAIGLPAIPFVGLPVLGAVFGMGPGTVTVAIGSLATNIVMVPLGLVLLGVAASGQKTPTTARSVGAVVVSSLQEPMVWAPLLGMVFVVVGIHPPLPLVHSMELLGSTTGGVALFATGVVLQSHRPALSRAIVVSTLGRLIVVPGLALLILPLLGLHYRLLGYPVVSLSLPCAVIIVIFAVRFNVAEQETASVLLYSYVLSTVTMAGFIAAIG